MRRRTLAFPLFFSAFFASSLAAAQPVRDHGLTSPLAPADRCNECHSGGTTSAGATYMAGDTWAASMMANAARDPLFLATLTVAEQTTSGVGAICLRCHSPSAHAGGRTTNGFGRDLDAVAGDLDGVHCDACHRSVVRPDDPAAPYLANAQLWYEDVADDTMVPRRHGPRTDAMQSPRHSSVGDPFIRDARMCGQCHNIDSPLHRLTPQGQDMGVAFPLQSTYTEWQQSDFSRRAQPETCQTCHMPLLEQNGLPSTRIPNAPIRDGQRQHFFQGANEWGMALLKASLPGEMDAAFDASRARIQAYLRTAARLEITQSPATGTASGTARITVRVTNLSGHKLPTGYEDARIMWIQVNVGSTAVSGAYVDDAVVEDAQVRTYEFFPGHFENGQVQHSEFVARHNVVIRDTRIPPLGMMPDARTAPVGRDYSGGPNGALRNDDTVTYNVPLPATQGDVPITVRLLYKTTTKHYVETIANANTTDARGRDLIRLFNATNRAAPFEMASATAMIHVGPAADPGGGASCNATLGHAGNARGVLSLAALAALVAARRIRRGRASA